MLIIDDILASRSHITSHEEELEPHEFNTKLKRIFSTHYECIMRRIKDSISRLREKESTQIKEIQQHNT